MRTPKSRALGRALREARLDKGIKLRDFAGQLGRDPGMLSRWETGERAPRLDQVAQILTLLGVNGDRFDEIINLTEGTHASQWLAVTLPEQRQQFAALLDLEASANKIVEASPLLIPGLLQTGPYIRSIMTAGSVPLGEIATRVAMRLGRKDILTKRGPVHLRAFVGEAALSQLIGSPEVMIEQLQHLTEMAGRSNVDLRVMPQHSGWHPGLEGAFLLIESRQATPVVQLENRRTVLFLHQDDDVDPYRRAVETIFRIAMSQAESTVVIGEYIKRWEAKL